MIKKANKTQSQLSIECGFNERRINNLSASCHFPDAAETVKIATALNTSVEYLVTGEDTSLLAEENRRLKKKIESAINTLID